MCYYYYYYLTIKSSYWKANGLKGGRGISNTIMEQPIIESENWQLVSLADSQENRDNEWNYLTPGQGRWRGEQSLGARGTRSLGRVESTSRYIASILRFWWKFNSFDEKIQRFKKKVSSNWILCCVVGDSSGGGHMASFWTTLFQI